MIIAALASDRAGRKMTSPNIEPAHGRSQQVVVIARHCLGCESGDLVLVKARLLCSLVAAAQNLKGIAIMAGQRDDDLRVLLGRAWISNTRSLGQRAYSRGTVQLNIKGLAMCSDRPSPGLATPRDPRAIRRSLRLPAVQRSTLPWALARSG